MSTSKWSAQAATGAWNTPSNWDPAGVPADTAVFAESSRTEITFSATDAATVNHVKFSSGASAYTFRFGSSASPGLTIEGQGVTNDSGVPQNFVVSAESTGDENPQLQFSNSASAGGSNMYYTAGPKTKEDHGGGVISFRHTSSAGSANFKAWTGAAEPPKKGSTVGGEISFSDSATAENASFTVHGTLGTDGDTFGNAAFHGDSTAARATFTNMGGTVSGGDGGNTQFFDNSTAADGVFHNRGGTYNGSHGGDVAFDGTATGGHGHFHNYAATAVGASGGVTSFNNNCPDVAPRGASAGHGTYVNYAAQVGGAGGGHTEFTAEHGSPTGGNGTFHNFGCAVETDDRSSAGHTIFSINLPTEYHPTAGDGIFWNHPGAAEGAPAGYTEFAVYTDSDGSGASGVSEAGSASQPTAGRGTFLNLGGTTSGAAGGYTSFGDTTTADESTLIALGGANGGSGGRIAFYDESTGGRARVLLSGNGVLDLGDHTNGVTIADLELTGGVVEVQLGSKLTDLTLTGKLVLHSSVATFEFWTEDGGGFEVNVPYTILTAPNLSGFTAAQFTGNSVNGISPTFTIVGDTLQVSFHQ